MNCFRNGRNRNVSSSDKPTPETAFPSDPDITIKPSEDLLLQIPECTVNLVHKGVSVELAKGNFTLVKLSYQDVPLVISIRVGNGNELQWLLTKSEPVVKLNELDYLFTLAMNDGEPLNYGVSFSEQFRSSLGDLDSLIKEYSCFSGAVRPVVSSSYSDDAPGLKWKSYAPSIEQYDGALAKAIAGETGEVVKGIFKLKDAYINKVQKAGEMIIARVAEENSIPATESNNNECTKMSETNKALERVKKVSEKTNNISKRVLNIVGILDGSIVVPTDRAEASKIYLGRFPEEVLVASRDAVKTVLAAAEEAERRAFSETSKVATVVAINVVRKKWGDSAGEATEHVLATAGHAATTCCNCFKIRKAVKQLCCP